MTYLDESYPADLLVAPGPFALTSVAPSTAVANTAPVLVSANGTNFTQFSRVIFDGKELPTTFIGNTQVRFTAPSHAVGAVEVRVKNGGSLTGPQAFTYTGATAGVFTPVGQTIAQVQQYVTGLGDADDPDVIAETQRVLEIERDNAARTTLIAWLDERLGVV